MEADFAWSYVTSQDICSKFIEINFSVESMVSQPNRLFHRSTTMSLIIKMSYKIATGTGGPPLVRSQLVRFPLVRIFRLISKIRTSGIVYVVKSY